jgi:gliding motility-associated-like protein
LKAKAPYVLFIFFLFTFNGYAQLVGSNVFLQGKYIRLGLTGNGSFGSTVSAPAGFMPPGADSKNFPICNSGRIGFIADAGRDGWDIGAPPFIGEYFLPGAPEEGWALSINGNDYNNNRSTEFIAATQDYCVDGTQIPGAFTNFQDLPDRQVADWEGMVAGVKIFKKITLFKNKLYFITEVKLVNTNALVVKNAYYMRNVDPDNEVVPTGSFKTRNKIEFQNPVSGSKALVSAKGLKYGSYLGLGTIDCRARVCIKGGQSSLANRVPKEVYDGTFPRLSALGDTLDDDFAVALAFRLGNIAPGDSVHFAFAYILSQSELGEALSKTAPQFEINGAIYFSGEGAINCTGNTLPVSIVNGNEFSWVWSPATGLNTTTGPSVVYTTQPKPVTYTATGNNLNCSDVKLNLTIYPPNSNVANFIVDSACGDKTVMFTNLSPPAEYLWDFGDGQTSTETSPVHTYAVNGSYTVRLTLTVPAVPTCGNVLTSTQMVNMKDNPVVSIGYANDACAGTAVSLQGIATVAGGNIISHQWTLPGGISYSTQNISPVFLQPGSYDILYEAISNFGCKASASKKIVVETTPVAAFIVTDGCTGTALSIVNQSTNVSGSITGYAWDAGNNNIVTGIRPSVVYSAAGNYNLQLTASTANGCSASVVKPVNIELTPVAGFSFTPACINIPVSFLNRSVGNVTKYSWDFDDGTLTSILNPVHTFSNERNYRVSLSAITNNGCISQPAVNMIAISKTKADAGLDTTVFKDTPFMLRGSGGIRYLWTPSSLLNNPAIANPVGMVQTDQLFSLTVIDRNGCSDSDVVKVTVFDHDDIYVPAAFSPNNDGVNDLFRVVAPTKVVYLFEVYNRWGHKVFSTTSQEKGWDGRLHGITQPTGVYVWIVKAKTRAGVNIEKKGSVTLLL